MAQFLDFLLRKNGSFVKLSCLLPELWSLKCQKWLIFCAFCWWQKNSSNSVKMFKGTWKYWVPSEDDVVYRLWSYRSWNIEDRNIEKTAESAKKISKFWVFRVDILLIVAQSSIPYNFLKELNKIFQMHLNILVNLWLIFLVISRKYKKWAILTF